MPQFVTRRMAEQTLTALTVAFADYVQEGYGPKLLEGWDGYDFVVIWEEGAPYDWTQLIQGGRDEYDLLIPAAAIPQTVWTEPVNNCVLALYRRA